MPIHFCMIHSHVRCFQWNWNIIHCHIFVPELLFLHEIQDYSFLNMCFFPKAGLGQVVWIQHVFFLRNFAFVCIFCEYFCCCRLMKRKSVVGLWELMKPDKEAKVSFQGSFWNVSDCSCLLTKASLQLFYRTHEKANYTSQ